MEQDEYLAEYEKAAKKQLPKGIPNFPMNKPIVTNTLAGTVGLELELEAQNMLPRDRDLGHITGIKTGASWNGIADGSLRGNSTEYVLSRPCGRDEIRPLIEGLYESMATFKTKLHLSNRCSTHVHINMAGKGINEITSAIVLWGVFEQALIAYCGEERKTNHFCLSSKETKSTIEAWSNLLNYGNSQFSRNLKYSALNIMPLYTLGSLEFRCGRASKTPDYPVLWATLIDTLVGFATTQYPNPRTLANDLSERGAIGLLEAVVASEPLLPASLVGQIIDATPGFENECLGSFRNYQELALAHPWEEWIELIKAPYIPDPFAKAKPLKYSGGEAVAPMRIRTAPTGRATIARAGLPEGWDQPQRAPREEDGILAQFVNDMARQRPVAEPVEDVPEPEWGGDADGPFAPPPVQSRADLLRTRIRQLRDEREALAARIQHARMLGRRPDREWTARHSAIGRELNIFTDELDELE